MVATNSNYRKTDLLLPVFIVLIGAALRFFDLANLPSGLFYDESADGVDALRVLSGVHPVFFIGNQGREPLYIYLQAISIFAIGPSPFTLRLTSAFLGILTIAVTYATFRLMAGKAVGLVGAFLLATLYWHLSLSRLAFRPVSLPLFIALAVFWLLKGTRTGHFAYFAIAGFFLGVDLYTYIPSRLAIALIGFWLLAWLIIPCWRRGPFWKALQACAITFIVFFVTILPIGTYFLSHPHDFIGRANTVARPLTPSSLFNGVDLALQALFVSGDPNPRHDMTGHPLIDVTTTIAGIIGVVSILRARRDPSWLLAIAWPVVMIIPAALSIEPAHALRLSGELPMILFAPAIGYAKILSQWPVIRHLSARNRLLSALVAACAVALVATAGSTVRDYFVVWANLPISADVFQSDVLHALDLIQQVPSNQPVMVTTDIYENQPIPLVFTPYVSPSVRGFDGRSDFVVPAQATAPIYYLYARTFVPSSGIPSMENFHEIAHSEDQFGRTVGRLFRLDPPFRPPLPQREISANVGGGVRFTGADISSVASPGTHEIVALHWIATGTLPPGQWEFFAHLVSRDHQQLIAQDYNHGFPPNQWRPGDQVISWFDLNVPANAPATVADVDFGIFNPDTGQRLPVTQPDGKPAGDAVKVGPTRIDRPGVVPTPQHPLALRLGKHILLDGYDLTPRPDGSELLQLHWHADGPIGHDYTVFAHRLDSQGKFLVAGDGEPGAGAYPTSTWKPGEEVLDTHVLPPAAEGSQIETGMYLLATGQRLPILDPYSGKLSGDSVRLTQP